MGNKVEHLLDDVALDGPVGVVRELCVARRGVLVDSVEVAAQEIEDSCQYWGGYSDLLVPAEAWNGSTLGAPWSEVASRSDLDQWVGPFDGLPEIRASGLPHRVHMAAVLAASDRPPESLATVRVPVLDPSDPWYVAYLAMFGIWPERPEGRTLDLARIRRDLSYDDLIPTSVETLSGSLDDAVDRLLDSASVYPAWLTRVHLAIDGGERQSNILPAEGMWASEARRAVGSRFGPNLVVIYQPGSLSDLCLAWALRAGNGSERGVPIAVPLTPEISSQLRTLRPLQLFRFFGLANSFGLVSLSVGDDVLQALAADLGEPWEVVSAAEVLRPCWPPLVRSTGVAVFTGGRAEVAAWPEGELDVVGRISSVWSAPPFRFRARPMGRLLPPSRSLSAGRWDPMYRGGHFEGGRPNRGEVVEMLWPAGWTVLEAVVRDRGLRARPSAPGQAAAALIAACGGVRGFDPLRAPSAFELLYRIASRPSLEMTIGDVITGLRVKTPVAMKWLTWAESRSLLVRGTTVACGFCGTRSWRPMSDLAPPVVCYGCGSAIKRPFPADKLEFRYRLSERLLPVLRLDALPHVLAFVWLSEFYEAHPPQESILYGAFPGVELLDANNEVIGEVDLAALFHDGAIAVGECKKRGNGLDDEHIDRLNRLEAEFGADWSFLATPAARDTCSPTWETALRGLPERPRYAFPGEVLFSHAIRTQSIDPFHWGVGMYESLPDRDARYQELLPAMCDRLLGHGDPDRALRASWETETRQGRNA